MCIFISLVIFCPCRRGKKVETNEIINHLRPFSGMWIILATYFDWLYSPTMFDMSSLGIPQSVKSADCIYEERVRLFPLPLCRVHFSSSIVLWYLPLFSHIYSSDFLLLVHNISGWMVFEHSIKFPFRIVLGGLIPILAISANLIPWFFLLLRN